MRPLKCESLETRCMLAGDVVISEFMAKNDTTIKDAFGDFSDWFEIHNDSGDEVDLFGWSVTDDPLELTKWTFDTSVTLPAGSRLIVWASDRDLVTDEGEIHTNFKLKSDGEYLGLVNPGAAIVSQYGGLNSDYPSLLTDVSFGLDSNGRKRHYLNPTPGLPNDDDSGGVVADTKFTVDRGFFFEAFSVTISSQTNGATLVYTLDGSVPSATNGTQIPGGVDGPSVTVDIDSTSTLRAMAYLDGWTSTNVDTQTYLFPEQIVRQTSEGLPDTWGHAGADYEMDPEVVDSPRYRDEIVDSLRAIPTVSLVTNIDDFFDRRLGIYPRGQNSPRVVSMEMLFPETGDDLQVEASVEIAGGSSTNRWKSDKLSMQLKFKAEFGDSKLRYPLFGPLATDSFDTLILDARLNQAWHYGGGSSPTSQRRRAQFTRDQFVADLQRELGGHAPHGQWIHLYLNGIYWGMYNLHERPDEHFAQDYLGGEKADYDVIKHNTDVVHGSYARYQQLLDATSQNLRLQERYDAVRDMLDIDEFISYMLVNYYVGNTDWAHHNWYATYNDEGGDGKWRYHSWDAEHVLKDLNDDPTGRSDQRGPTRIHHQLMRNSTYRLKFMDAVQATLLNDGLFTPASISDRYQQSLDRVREAIVADSARWGDNQRSRPYTRDVEWEREANRLLDDYFPQRAERLVDMLRDRRFFHRYDAPAFGQHGGNVNAGIEVEISTSGGTIFYTTDGSDPRTSDTAVPYSGPVPLDQTTTIRTRALRDSSEWSAVTMATFLVDKEGDFSGNGVLDAEDLDLLMAAISTQGNDTSFDLDGDGEVGDRDIDYWLVELADTRRGDSDLDGDVDFTDFLVLSGNFGSEDRTWQDGNFNDDGNVDFADFLLLSLHFGWQRP